MKRLLASLILTCLVSCSSVPSRTTDTHSSTLPDLAAREQFLKDYAKLPTAVEDLAFQVVYHDNSEGLPGPSDWDIQVVAKVTQADLATWTIGLTPSENSSAFEWVSKVSGWTFESEPEFYLKDGVETIVFAPDRVVARRWLTR